MKRLWSILIVFIVIHGSVAQGQEEEPMLEPIPIPQPRARINTPPADRTVPPNYDPVVPIEGPSFPNQEIIVDDPAASTTIVPQSPIVMEQPPYGRAPSGYEIAPAVVQDPIIYEQRVIVEYPRRYAHVVHAVPVFAPRHYRGVGVTVYREVPRHRVVTYEVRRVPAVAPAVYAAPYQINVVPPPIVHVHPRFVPGQPVRNLIRAAAFRH